MATKDSVYTVFHTNGVLQVTGLIRNNKKEGKWFAFDDEGSKLLEYEFKNDSLNGESIEYRDNKVFSKMNYMKDVKEGYCVYYDVSKGIIFKEGEYKNDLMDGIWNEYDCGELMISELFKEGKLIKIIYRSASFDTIPPKPCL